nr:hypothetical protein [Piscinibacter sp.]
MDDALHRAAAHRAGLAETAMHRHLGSEGGHLLRPAALALRLVAQPRGPFLHHGLRRREQARRGVGVERARQRDGRQPRAVQDLVGVRIADAAEQPRIRQRALERVVLGLQPRQEGGRLGAHHVDAAGVLRGQRVAPGEQVQRGAAFRACFGEHQRAGIELEGRQCRLRRFGAGGQPLQPAGDHQVDDEVQLALEGDHHPLAEPLDAGHWPPLGAADRRHRGTQHEGVRHAHTLQRGAVQPGRQALDVDGDVRQFRHAAQCASPGLG